MNHTKFGVNILTAAVRLGIATLAAGVAAPTMAAEETTRVIVVYKIGASAKDKVKGAIVAARGVIKHEIDEDGAVAVELTKSELAKLARNPDVDFIEEDVKRYPSSLYTESGPPYHTGQWVPYGVKMVQADLLSDQFASNRKICIIDSGYDRGHEDLQTERVTGKKNRGTGWWYKDGDGHGTHVAGTIVGANNLDTGVVGILPNKQVQLHIVKVFGSNGKWAFSSDLVAAANQCGKVGANVINMSLGGPEFRKFEQKAFERLERSGVLSIAAAGNAGNSKAHYPAGYGSVMSVGALDVNKKWARFSQYNSKVEISAPGVQVLSTVPMNSLSVGEATVDGVAYTADAIEGSPRRTATAPLADMGTGGRENRSAMKGKVCLIKRGDNTIGEKVANCEAGGGVGAIIYNTGSGNFYPSLDGTVTKIPSVTVSGTHGAVMMTKLGTNATVVVRGVSYAYEGGTSMATPHVSGVAALVWSYFPKCSGKQIRASLGKSAQDLGAPGRDDKYGYGLVQAYAAYERVAKLDCGK